LSYSIHRYRRKHFLNIFITMAAQTPITVIRDLAMDCEAMFDKMLGLLVDNEDHGPATEPIFQQRSSFMKWSRGTGAVEARQGSSLDERLRDDVKTQALVIGMLYMTKSHLQTRKAIANTPALTYHSLISAFGAIPVSVR
jgi:hypothetical protein